MQCFEGRNFYKLGNWVVKKTECLLQFGHFYACGNVCNCITMEKRGGVIIRKYIKYLHKLYTSCTSEILLISDFDGYKWHISKSYRGSLDTRFLRIRMVLCDDYTDMVDT